MKDMVTQNRHIAMLKKSTFKATLYFISHLCLASPHDSTCRAKRVKCAMFLIRMHLPSSAINVPMCVLSIHFELYSYRVILWSVASTLAEERKFHQLLWTDRNLRNELLSILLLMAV